MLSFPIGKLRSEHWFSKKPSLKDIAGFHIFKQALSTRSMFGFKREDFYTKNIDLSKPDNGILDQFEKSTKYKVNRAIRENVEFHVENDVHGFISFYNEFAATKGLPLINDKMYFQNNEYFKITKAAFEGKTLVMHCYLMDKDTSRARLLYSASHFRNMESSEQNFIGRANRFLHYKNMLYFKEMGFALYDLGGYGKDTANEEIIRINAFKDGFGGSLDRQSNYTPYLYILLKKLKPS